MKIGVKEDLISQSQIVGDVIISISPTPSEWKSNKEVDYWDIFVRHVDDNSVVVCHRHIRCLTVVQSEFNDLIEYHQMRKRDGLNMCRS